MYTPIYFNDEVISQLPVYDDLLVNRALMAEDEIPSQIELPGTLYCPIGAYILYRGRKYTVNTIPSPQVTGDVSGLKYTYNITFESDLYRLYDKKFKHLNNKTFSFYGDLSELCLLVVSNINEIDSGWSVGICDDLGLKTVEFDKHDCRTALDAIAEAFSCEWYLSGTGKEINFVKQAGNVTTLVFQYGRGKGLYSLGYQYQNDENIVTRAFGYGSSRNLPKNYRDGATELMFDGYYLDKNTDLYRVKEGDYVNEDIYPTIAGNVSAVSAFDPDAATFTITDSGLTFNLNTYFSPDTPKVSFTSGQLQGQEFEIVTYDNTSKVIKLKVATDAAGNNLPSAEIQAVVGDTYTLFDMYLPDEAVQAAEDKLQAATQTWLDENSVPRVLYNLELDPLYAKFNGIMLEPGDQIRVVDDALGIDAMIRVTSVSYPVNFPDIITPNTKITATIANFIPYTTTERVVSDTIDNQHEIKVVNRTNIERARLNALNLKKLQTRIFNPDGSLFTGTDSLVAGMATFGYDSQNMNLNDVVISPNLLGNPNDFKISGGQLIHYIYKIEGLGYIWTLGLNSWTGLDPAKYYYVYAKCSKVAITGTWEISETGVGVNDIPGYFAFNLGILYEVNTDGYRTFQSTKGVTTIVGDQITSGLIQDITGQNYINLTTGQFNMGDADSGIDWDVTNPGFLTIRGGIASKVIQVGSDGVVNARISGVTDAGADSIRFASGPGDEFKVLDNGKMYATDAEISGDITAKSGTIGGVENPSTHVIEGGFSILQNQMAMNLDHGGGNINQVLIGDNVISGVFPNLKATGIFRNVVPNVSSGDGVNSAMVLEASNADTNIALEIVAGDIHFTSLPDRAIGGATYTGKIRAYTDADTGIQYLTIEND
ncbi:phage tail protein [Mucilaginibacter sabulilitoris]|uniref:Phage tail protein n=1 Tax=Mucilaginibacter sabulilitoris TaxID=1173583 RepID=A0ABZ0TF38_9SPHI|nr:phage tail protein [Mucilaginibacter sabulilitoris]WPU91784.1 phage tail protein [Mucilaginibacter sabulilitoris]